MKTSPVTRVARELAGVLREHAAEWGIKPDALELTYITNSGGFVNHSFRAWDGSTALHIKLATPEDQPRLERWLHLGRYLSTRYHAPVTRGWIDVPASALSGLVFEHIDGVVATNWNAVPMDDLAAVLNRLHDDRDLARQMGPATVCADSFFDTFDDRFREDLKGIRVDTPDFVTPGVLDYLTGQAERLAETVRASDAFCLPADAVIHSDVWLNNILMADSGWFLLDWDNMMRGDPALDAAMTGGPQVEQGRWPLHAAFHPRGAAFRDRVAIYQQACMLDWCIDVLADYTEAPRWLDDPASYQADKRQMHERALQTYRTVYADTPR